MKKVAVLLLGTVMLSGCGSDDSGDSRASRSYIGAIESVDQSNDSMIVNSMPLSLASANIELNGHYVNSTELDVGMQVDIEYDDGVAYEVDIDPEIVGMVTDVTPTTITVNGQVLNTKKDFTGNALEGKRAMLFGYVDQHEHWQINAAYEVGSIPVLDLYEGRITSVPTFGSFNIGTLSVNYSNNNIDSEDRHELKQGAWVEIEGRYDSANNFSAYEVDVEDGLDLANAEIEGYVTAINTNKTSMTLNGKTVVAITENTRFEDGIKSDLAIGRKVDVDLINNAGQLQASEIEFD
ncbi:DUF5666 domain-containing protein [Aliivibrio sp. S4TY2]|uniref:DUF5666 domain-containing protein n=1 Tax=unclassified Aliivibrio TaxID=2645654 RepID=UPI0023781B46|nr:MULTISPECIES: DUF5666 domain-containing protein [unclassified Aliivibrio]MDD9156840.1 DUF5666 domain-containing protein [Aliivibrio sp. S4TY2]MDD9160326.1 DUF5666 domain-containing protein [Aliivibrio sp. S4TY1]MDD9164381.1 DUF5666 domain-containing protein [Aliivibrio sp. S4MY2]MDD9168749.1 DUF5666 domain-containing protein [Aliivibrio sp. S4MY4]MDD9184716.1 DUF5666 domain-containing protein [Aliivibrio sp. S4MY3]